MPSILTSVGSSTGADDVVDGKVCKRATWYLAEGRLLAESVSGCCAVTFSAARLSLRDLESVFVLRHSMHGLSSPVTVLWKPQCHGRADD
jgi:hypothetical protein